ncbi:hypothetical protein LUZ60_011303 [Juncus effusus]|nr:hypothetical protein LUZ60_011303 [Juncus effusus]
MLLSHSSLRSLAMDGGTTLSISRFPPPSPPLLLRHLSLPPLRASATSLPSPKALVDIQSSKIIACLRAQDGKMAVEAACAAITGGVTVLEIVMSTPGALEVIKMLRTDFPSVTLGVGTVLSFEDAKKAVKAGAQFLMSPCTVPEILHGYQSSEILYIPGVMTPTEIFSAYNAGAQIVKIYPVSLLGGEKYISTLKRPFPNISMIASQGITTDSIEKYMEAGTCAVVLSDAIFDKEAMSENNFEEIQRLANLAMLQSSQARK